MGKLSSLLWGAALGAGMMYFMDPQNGNRRKALVRDRVYRMRSQGDQALDTAVHDLRHRVQGVLAEGIALVSEEGAPDYLLEERIRSRMGFLTRHPGAIQVRVQNHQAIISGDILADEVDNLMKGVARVHGIKDVTNELRVHQDAGNIPQLQGEGWLPGQNGSSQWAPSTRLVASIGAGYLLLYGMLRGGIIGSLAQLSGAALGARALTNLDMRRMAGVAPEGDAIRVRKSIQIQAPVEQVYDLWSHFENFSRFMNNVESIRDMGNGRSHWVVKGPAGSKVEFDAITTEMIPNEVVAWQTTPDSQVRHQGQVRFRDSGQGGTQVSVTMSYTPPAGIAGHAVAALFGKDPKSEMDADLARMKSLLEEGKTTAGKQRVRQEDIMPGHEVSGHAMPVTGGRGASNKQRNRPGDRGGTESGGDGTTGMGSGDMGNTMSSRSSSPEIDDSEDIAPLAPSDQ